MDKATQIFEKAVKDLQADDVNSLIHAEAGFNFLLDRNPHSADLWFYVAACFMKRGFYAVAEELLQKNVKMDPKSVAGYNNLGFVYKQDNRTDKAEHCFRKAIELFPDLDNKEELSTMWNNLATLYVNNGTPDRAIKYCIKAFECDPDNIQAHWNHSLALLEKGRWKEGWEEHEYGLLNRTNKRKDRDYGDGLPMWDGTKGKRVIVFGEQGIGDEIMFMSMMPDLIRDCSHVIYDAHPRLVSMARESFPEITVYGTRKEKNIAWYHGQADYRIGIGSLGKYYRNDSASFPKTSYLKSSKYPCELVGKRPKIGISWKGGYVSTRKDLRSVTLDQMRPILDMDAEFHSLQYTEGAADEVSEFTQRTGIVIHHDQELIDDYDRTAGFIQELDLIITVCTSLVHLSGAIGVPCWVMTPSRPAWRYGVTGDMPWYGSVKLYRQRGDDWQPVMEKIREDACKRFQKNIAA